MAEVALEPQAGVPGQGPDQVAGRSPWALAWRRLRRNRIALGGARALHRDRGSRASPRRSTPNHIAHTDPFENNLNGTTIVNGKEVPLMQQGGGVLHLGETPIGPTWDVHHYFLGADAQGRDVAARMLYGGRSSLAVGIGSALIACLIATVLALIAGFYGGAHRLAAVTAHGRDLGVPGDPVRDLRRDRAPDRHPTASSWGRSTSSGVEPLAADAHHRLHLRAVRLPAGPRPRCSRWPRRSSSRPPSPRARRTGG